MLDFWARRKGIQVVGAGDFTHAAWRAELREKLIPAGDGLYTLRQELRQPAEVAGETCQPQFMMSGEISCIYKKHGRVRKVHNLILLPGIEEAERISRRLEAIGNLHSDGRPILGLDSRDLLEIALESCPETIFIPAHIWTPHFSLYGAYSGFDDIEECFGDLTGYVYALETGLSSDPPMNWRLSALDRFALVSNSDAHSPANLGREANLFATGIAYSSILQALKNPTDGGFQGTLEFFPEEGKYHCDGHRACKICLTPAETRAAGGVCPVCGGRITVGVLHRVETLADRPLGAMSPAAKHFERLAPLAEVIAASIGFTAASGKVKARYDDLLRTLGPEFFILRDAALADLEIAAGACITEGIRRLRLGQVEWEPGFDGEYGKMHLMNQQERDTLTGQQGLFAEKPALKKPARKRKAAADMTTLGPLVAADGSSLAAEPKSSECLPYGMNAAQWSAVASASPAIAVVAGPGTGKTKTLVSRIAYLVEKCGVAPAQVTAVTFTNKAAQEMRSRLAEHFGDKRTVDAMTIGTFHSIGLKRLPPERRNLPVIDEYHAVAIVEEVLREKGLALSPREVLREISLIKNGSFSGNATMKQNVPAAVCEAYGSRLHRYGVMDYDDILLGALQIAVQAAPEPSFAYLLVDEFQDINEIQYRLLREWSQGGQAVFIIGDPDQAIYGFRGSDFRYFDRFAADYPAARHFRLTENYRSTPEIVAASQAVIAGAPKRKSAGALVPNREPGGRVRVVQVGDSFRESLFVAKEINRMIGGVDMLDAQMAPADRAKQPMTARLRGFADIAVIYRTNHQAESLEQCLQQEGIPYVVAGRGEYFSTPLVREALAFFKLLLNPADLASLLVCLDADGPCPPECRAQIVAGYTTGEKSTATLKSLLQSYSVQMLAERLEKFTPVIHKQKPGDCIEAWAAERGLTGEKCMEWLRNTAVAHEDMGSFMQNLVLGREGDIVRSGRKTYPADAVSLLTIHAAKGLEFPVVFVCGVNDGLIPLRNNKLETDLEEERRLFYVGMTRARDELLLLTSSEASPFLADLPPERICRELAFEWRQTSVHKQASLFD